MTERSAGHSRPTTDQGEGPAILDLLIVLTSLRQGGVQRAVGNLVPVLEDEGFRIGVTVLDPAGADFMDLVEKWYVPAATGMGFRRQVAGMRALLGRLAPKAVVSILPLANLVTDAALTGRRDGPVHISWEQNNFDAGWLVSMPWLKRVAVRAMLARCYRRSSALIASSVDLAAWIEQHFRLPEGAVHVLPNPVDVPGVRAGRSSPPSVWRQDKIKVLAAGRLVAQKDFPTMIRAVAACRCRDRLCVCVAGDGPERPALEEMVDSLGLGDIITFAGFRDDVYGLMNEADVFLLTSRWEGFASVLAEALAAGCLVISTDCPFGPREVLSGGECGVLVEVGDFDGIARALDDFAEEPDRFTRYLGIAGRRADDLNTRPVAARLGAILRGVGVTALHDGA